jgi:dTDP-4-dehydrorhamnose 3,5-epimerase
MIIKPTTIPNSFIIEPEPICDNRGFFNRVFCQHKLQDILQGEIIAQINHSATRQKGSLRGLHFQYPPRAEIKIVKCLRGSLFDVMVDLRRGSPAFLYWYGKILSAENMTMLFIPEGCAHGFQTLEDNSEILYLTTEFYSPEHEDVIRHDDPRINISWPLQVTGISAKDQNAPFLPPDFKGIA